jgi:hypothetical protein
VQLLQWPIVKQEHWRNVTRIRIQRKEQEKGSPSFAAEREGMRQFYLAEHGPQRGQDRNLSQGGFIGPRYLLNQKGKVTE